MTITTCYGHFPQAVASSSALPLASVPLSPQHNPVGRAGGHLGQAMGAGGHSKQDLGHCGRGGGRPGSNADV